MAPGVGYTSRRRADGRPETWKLKWPKEETKNKRHAHEIVLVAEELAIAQRAWTNRLPDCGFLSTWREAARPGAFRTQAHLRASWHLLRARRGYCRPRHPTLGDHNDRECLACGARWLERCARGRCS